MLEISFCLVCIWLLSSKLDKRQKQNGISHEYKFQMVRHLVLRIIFFVCIYDRCIPYSVGCKYYAHSDHSFILGLAFVLIASQSEKKKTWKWLILSKPFVNLPAEKASQQNLFGWFIQRIGGINMCALCVWISTQPIQNKNRSFSGPITIHFYEEFLFIVHNYFHFWTMNVKIHLSQSNTVSFF